MHREYDPSAMGLAHQAHPEAPGHAHEHKHEHDPEAERRRLIATTLVVGVLLAAHLAAPLWEPSWQRPFGLPLALLAAVIGGGRVVYLALMALFEGRIGADIALAIACIAAALLGEYFVAAEVVFIALVGECLEAFAFGRAQRAIRKLLDLRPALARVRRDGRDVELRADLVAVGDLLIVRPGERVAADGTVETGRSSVDQSPLTGEGLAVDKGPGDPVFTGTVNEFGGLEVRVEKVGAATTLGQVIKLLSDAQKRKGRLERTADRYARRFLPAVLAAAAIVLVATNARLLWDLSARFRGAATVTTASLGRIDVLPMLAVLVVACPCALVLATPAAVLAATARLARRGVLVKGGQAIERLAEVNCLAFDKTGTLTEGKPELADQVAFENWQVEAVLRFAAAAERPSEHPLARVLVAEADRLGIALPEASEFQAQPGAGVIARVEGQRVLVGNVRLAREQGVAITPEVEAALARLDAGGQTVLLVVCEGRVVGLLGARDRVRREAHDVIHDLKHLGLKELAILTGDRPSVARAVAKKVHVKQFESEMTPSGKAEWVRARQAEGRVVGMVGDGINDAPALALADVGIALGGVGTDIAAEAGSILLMGEPLAPLPDAITLARRTRAIIRQNILVFAFGLNGVAVVLAGLRVLGPVAAAILHQIGSLLVILNALRILGLEGFEQFGAVRAGVGLVAACRRCRPSVVGPWVRAHRRALAAWGCLAALMGYGLSGLTRVEADQVGLLQRWGRYVGPPLGPGLHARWPWPMEWTTKVEPDRVRVARVGLAGTGASPNGASIAWSASHGGARDESSLFLTGDENLVELSGVVEYHLTAAGAPLAVFGAAGLEGSVQAAAESAFREVVGESTLETILVADRRGFESKVKAALSARLRAGGLVVVIDQARVVDAHPPREVVPAYRDVSAAEADAARFLNEAEGYAAEQAAAALAEARSRRDAAAAEGHLLVQRATGERAAFLAQQQARAAQPALTEFRLLHDALGATLADRPKLLLDPRAAGRKQLWLDGPERFGLGPALPILAQPEVPIGGEPDED